MPAPIVGAAAAAAARLLAKKLAKDSAKKVVKKAAKSNAKAIKSSRKDINKEVKVIQKANARGLKAANKPTNKVGSKADKEIRSRTKSVQTSKEETKALYDYYYGKGSGEGITQINKQVTPKNEAMSVRKLPKKSK